MKRSIVSSLLCTGLLVLATAAAGAEESTVNTVTLRAAGVPESGLTALEAPVEEPTPPEAVPLMPDDLRLVDLVRLVKSGISESIIAEQMRQSGPAFNLSVNDLLYLKQNGVQESIIKALMSPGGTQAAPGAAGAPPPNLTFDDLVQVRSTFLKKDRSGRLVMRGNSLAWVDGRDSKNNFEFQINGLKKVWFTCQARTPENFCYQINFEIVKGAQYRFSDVNRESGSNASVLKVMEALRQYFPQVAFGPPDA